MINKTIFNERPEALCYITLPSGKADIWLRKNIREFAVEESENGEGFTVSKWAAEEAYMRASLPLSAIEADLDAAFERAAAWKQGDDEPQKPTELERIGLLEKENAELFRQLTETQLALCELYESLI